MMRSKRHEQILRATAETGQLSVTEAVALLGASQATIRRDFNQLTREGTVERVRGGIRMVHNQKMLPFAFREVRNLKEKLAIARHAVQLLKTGDVVFVDGGTTTLQLGEYLLAKPLRIITNSVRLSAALESRSSNRAALEIFLTGGFLFPHSGLLVGPSAQAGLGQYHANWAFLSASGLSEAGLFNDNEHVVESERVMIANADRVVVLADHSKIGKHAMCHICNLERIDILITDKNPLSDQLLDQLTRRNLETIRVSV